MRKRKRILMLVNWQLRYSKEDIPNEQPSNKVVEGRKYWFFRHWDDEDLKVDVVDFTKLFGVHTLEKRFLKFYVSQALRVLPDLDGYDLILSHSAQSGVFLALLKTLLGKRTPPHIIIDPGSFNGGREKVLELLPLRMSLSSVTGVIGHSSSQVPFYTHTLCLSPDRFRIVHVGVDTEFYCPSESERSEDYVVCMGYMKRDWETLLRAWRQLKTGSELLIVGKEGLDDGLAGVKCMPYVPRSRLREIISRARFVVIPLPHHTYSFGQMSLLIAQALGKAVIATRVPGLLDYVEEGKTALFANPYDIQDMKKKIDFLLTNREATNELAREARKTVVRKYSERQMAVGLKDAVNELCKNT